MHDYTKLDTVILERIHADRGNFTALCVALRDQAEPYMTNARNPLATKVPAWRVIDRRLQSLRSRGTIVYDRKRSKWRVAPTSPNKDS